MEGKDLESLIREILRLRTEENMTYRQIAETVGISHVMVGNIFSKLVEVNE
ncbi:sigma factor-like helix-turn-helix DNA-binding protein [Micromonospora sp. NPDC047187]|uniref:sigma factor-like helix-turn-helix DNA-binding protein n=1 Tax=Micromonospora sp. NPDC047187 TaxID=3155262 RepID=UPI0033EA4056